MITRADDYPIHQTPEPIANVATTGRDFYDRYFFNGYSRDGALFFAVAFGQYPKRGVMDAAFSVIHDGRQHVLRASRRLGAERMDTRVGPIAIEVCEPLRTLKVVVSPNRWGLSGELTFSARIPALEEPRFYREHEGRVFMDSTRMTQHVAVGGTIEVAGEQIRLSPERFWGSRDRSWGIRPVGERDPDAPSGPLQFFWLWSPLNFEDLCTHFDVNEEADGSRWHQAGVIAPVGGTAEECASVSHRIAFRSGTRHAQRADLTLVRRSGQDAHIELRPLYEFYMSGIGYTHPQWGHGMFVGDDVATGESWKLDEVDASSPLHLHVQAVCEARFGERRGIGVLEQLIIGPHAPSGFKDLLDMAP